MPTIWEIRLPRTRNDLLERVTGAATIFCIKWRCLASQVPEIATVELRFPSAADEAILCRSIPFNDPDLKPYITKLD